MAYVKTEWETGDIITAEKLNNMEDGIESIFLSSIYAVPGDYSNEDVLSEEILNAVNACFGEGVFVLIQIDSGDIFIGSTLAGFKNVTGSQYTLSLDLDSGEITISSSSS